MKSLYTFVLDYEGGTYVFQVKGSSPEDAMFHWIEEFDFQGKVGIKKDNKESVLIDIKNLEKQPIDIEGMKNVWCISFLLDGELALAHFVKTSVDL